MYMYIIRDNIAKSQNDYTRKIFIGRYFYQTDTFKKKKKLINPTIKIKLLDFGV